MSIFYLFTETITYNAENTIINGRKFLFFSNTYFDIATKYLLCFSLKYLYPGNTQDNNYIYPWQEYLSRYSDFRKLVMQSDKPIIVAFH